MQPQNITLTKTCTKCGETKPATTEYFGRAKYGRYGLRSVCKECRKQEEAARRAADPTYYKRYYAANSERIKQNTRNWNKVNKERKTEANRIYRNNKREEILEQKRAYAAANREREAKRARMWHAANRERHKANISRRRARELEAEGTHTGADIRAQYKRQGGRCYYCGEKVGKNYHVDHVVPLSRGGANDPDNLVIACPFCNLSKHDKLPSEWPQGGRLL